MAGNALNPVALISSREGIVGPAPDIDRSGARDSTSAGGANPVSYWEDRIAYNLYLTEALSGISYADTAGKDGVEISFAGGSAPVTLNRPTDTMLHSDAQIGKVLGHAKLRAERAAEITAQINDLPSFYGSILNMNPDRHKHSLMLMQVCLDIATACALQAKHRLFVKRPADIDARVQPMLIDPGHGSCPSGHASEAKTIELVMLELLKEGWATAGSDKYFPVVEQQMDRLTKRIAVNRIIAGLHYEVDNDEGFKLAAAVAPYLAQQFKTSDILKQLWNAAVAEWVIAPRNLP